MAQAVIAPIAAQAFRQQRQQQQPAALPPQAAANQQMQAMNALGARRKAFYRSMRRDSLRTELRTRHLEVSGLKGQLEDRLVADDVRQMREPRMVSHTHA